MYLKNCGKRNIRKVKLFLCCNPSWNPGKYFPLKTRNKSLKTIIELIGQIFLAFSLKKMKIGECELGAVAFVCAKHSYCDKINFQKSTKYDNEIVDFIHCKHNTANSKTQQHYLKDKKFKNVTRRFVKAAAFVIPPLVQWFPHQTRETRFRCMYFHHKSC